MANLKVKEIKDFIKYSSSIKSAGSLPVLEYIKLEKNLITKTNLAIYCSMDIVCDIDEPILIDQNLLEIIINKTASNEIKITKAKDKILISDGVLHLDHGIEDVSLFPKLNDKPEKKGVLVNTPIIEAIEIARAFVSSEDTATNFRCVHFKDNFVFAINNGIFYIQKFNYKFPNVILLDEYCDIITQFKAAFFSQTEHHYFYDFDFIKFAFTKTEYPSPDVLHRVEILNKVSADIFKISKKDLIDFCEIANALTPSKNVYCSFKFDPEHEAVLVRQDADYTKNAKKQIYVDGNIENYDFNSRYLINAFKALPQAELSCQVQSNTLIIKHENSYACFSAVDMTSYTQTKEETKK